MNNISTTVPHKQSIFSQRWTENIWKKIDSQQLNLGLEFTSITCIMQVIDEPDAQLIQVVLIERLVHLRNHISIPLKLDT